VQIIALVLFLIGLPLAFVARAVWHSPFFSIRRERYTEGDDARPTATTTSV
jgi:hypothetical protein